MCYRREMPELSILEGMEVWKWSGMCEESFELFAVDQDRVVIGPLPLFKVIGDRK